MVSRLPELLPKVPRDFLELWPERMLGDCENSARTRPCCGGLEGRVGVSNGGARAFMFLSSWLGETNVLVEPVMGRWFGW